jgi:hypothetical protein
LKLAYLIASIASEERSNRFKMFPTPNIRSIKNIMIAVDMIRPFFVFPKSRDTKKSKNTKIKKKKSVIIKPLAGGVK